MKAKLFVLAALSAATSAAYADGQIIDSNGQVYRPAVTTPAPAVTTTAPVVSSSGAPVVSSGASSGSSTPPVYVTQPAAVAPATVVAPAVVAAPEAPVTTTPGASGPGATDKTRPGYGDDGHNHSTRDVGTSSAGG